MELNQFFDGVCTDSLGIAEVERQAIEVGREHAKAWLTERLQEKIHSVDWPARLDDPEGGEPYRLKEWPQRQINSAVGPIVIKVPTYRKTGKPLIAPHVNMFAMRGTISPLMLLRAASAGADRPFAKAAEELKELTGAEIAGETIRVLAQELGAIALEKQLEPEVPADFASPRRISVYLDGGRVPTHEGWREPRLARIELQNERGDIHTLPLTRICPAEAFWQLLEPLLERLGARTCSRLAFLGDGALWILPEAKRRFPHALAILDLYHVCERLHDTGKAIYGETNERAKPWARGITRQLKRGRIEFVLTELNAWHERANTKTRGALRKLLDFLEPRKEQMRYLTFRRRGFPIGSGRIESMIKHVSNQRLKRNGSRWSIEQAEAMLALRAAKMFGHLKQAWHAYVTPITTNIPPPLRPLLTPQNTPRNQRAA